MVPYIPVRAKIFHILPDLVENLRSLIASQYAEADRAICGRGNFMAWHAAINIYWWQPDRPAPSRIQMLGRNWKVVVYQVPTAHFFEIKFYNANQCLPRRHKSKHWITEWATFEEYWYALEYKAPLISTSTSFLQPSPKVHQKVTNSLTKRI